MKSSFQAFIIFLFLLGGTTSASALDLVCPHLVPIQKRFLARHVSYSNFDKNLEVRTIDRFVKTLDPSKIYFTQEDVSKIKKSMNSIFEKTVKGDCAALYAARDLLNSRVQENIELAKNYLDKDFKFDPKTRIVIDSKKRDYPKTKAEKEGFQKKFIQLQIANYLAADTKPGEAREKLIKNYARIEKRMKDKKQNEVLVNYLDAFATALDPHSTYWASDTFEEFQIDMSLSLEGIGATLSSKDGFTTVEQLIPGGAAEKSGQVKQKDKIVGVAQGKDSEFEDVIDLDLQDVVKKIRGPKGSTVRLKVLRNNPSGVSNLIITLVREKISIEDGMASITYQTRQIDGKHVKVGLLNLPGFYADTRGGEKSAASDTKRLLKEARKNNVDAVVLDLSTNGGGSLQDAVEISGLFFRKGNVVKNMSRDPLEGETLADKDPQVDYAGPLVVLTSRVSASASEIVAGTIKDYKRGVVVGADHTYGKGSIQALEQLPSKLGALKTTIGMYFLPGGDSTQHIGVDSDIEFPSVFTVSEIGEKTQDYSLPPKKISPFLSAEAFVPTGIGAWQLIDAKVITKLKSSSSKRVAKDPEFKKINDDITKSKKRNEKPEIVLAELLQDRKDSDEEEQKQEEGKTYAQSKLDRQERYLKRADIQEALNIAAELAILQNPAGEYKLSAKEALKSPDSQVKPNSNN